MKPLLHLILLVVFVTSYNPVSGQTDSDACTGASGRNLCVAAREGDHTIALSRDLLGRFHWHDKVRMVSTNPSCAGVYSVEDTMAARFSNRADLFFSTRDQNTSCVATLSRLDK